MRRAPMAIAFALLLGPVAAHAAGVSAAEKERGVLAAVFPEADDFAARDVVLTDDLVARIEKLARAKVKERLVTFYTARKGGAVVGHAVIHSHVVRTKRETFATQSRTSSSKRRTYARTLRFATGRNSIVPRPKALNSFRSAMVFRIQWRSEEGSRSCTSTFTAW